MVSTGYYSKTPDPDGCWLAWVHGGTHPDIRPYPRQINHRDSENACYDYLEKLRQDGYFHLEGGIHETPWKGFKSWATPSHPKP